MITSLGLVGQAHDAAISIFFALCNGKIRPLLPFSDWGPCFGSKVQVDSALSFCLFIILSILLFEKYNKKFSIKMQLIYYTYA